MRKDRTFDADHARALAIAVIVHALLAAAWWAGPERRAAARPDHALQVTWIERPAPPPSAPEPGPAIQAPPRADRPAPVPPLRPRDARGAADPAPAPPPAQAPRPLSAVFLEQGAERARADAGHDFRRNPLLDRPPAIEAPPPERIRMRDPLTPARIAAGIGQLFGGPGYEADPCPRIRRNIGNLRTAGADDAALQEELHRHRQFCQG